MKFFYKSILIFGIWFSVFSLQAQIDSTLQRLDTVVLTDVRLKHFSTGYKITKLSDSLLKRNSVSLTDALRYNSTIYLKEQGYGMTSTVSFRGTNASQTAVIWNGIAVNSVLNGQMDFNTLLPQSFSSISIRAGGGSVQYGSGAVGGSIHLNNDIQFKKTSTSRLQLNYGSYNTLNTGFKTIQASEGTYMDAGVVFVASDNDFPVLKTGLKNQNGAFSRFTAFLNTGIRFKNHILSYYSNYYYGDRNFSSTLTTTNKDGYKDLTTRNMIQLQSAFKKWENNLKVAHLFERYNYYPDKNEALYFTGQARSIVFENSLKHLLSKAINITALINYTTVVGEGSAIESHYRATLAPVLIWKHTVSSRFTYSLNFRKEFLNRFKNPFLVSIDGSYQCSKMYALTFNASKNYRIPTFNDLYWQGAGNPDLQPETSLQGELGNTFLMGNFTALVNFFVIYSDNLIKWQPQSNGLWQPLNIANTKNYGAELSLLYQKKIRNFDFSIVANYAYTKAMDTQKNKQLIYVPYHQATGTINASQKKVNTYIQVLYTGNVFTTTDNKGILDDYTLVNTGVTFNISKKQTAGLQVNNIFNKYYENIAYRPMPNRNIQITLNFNI